MRKVAAAVGIIILLLGMGGIWYIYPVTPFSVEENDVKEIEIFNGNTGNTTILDDTNDISYIIKNLNQVKLKRDKLSVGYSGYSFRITIHMKDGKKESGWTEFIINSADTIRKDPFFYTISEGSLDYDYISNIVE